MDATQISQAQLEANQANALLSTGPRTDEGKAVARYNARRHGLTGQFYCMSEADEVAYQSFEAAMLGKLAPEGAYETQLAISITQDHWRLNRSRGVEFNLYGRGHDTFSDRVDAPTGDTHSAATMADTWRADHRALSNIALYETRIHRMIVKTEKQLAELQAERKAAEQLARDEAKLLLRLEHLETETVDTKDKKASMEVNGFVFSTAALVAEINREERLKKARYYLSNGWSTAFPYRGDRTIPLKAA